MNKAFIATAFLVLLVLTHAETFEKAKLRGIGSKMSTEALFKSMKDSQFGKTLLNMLTLKFKTSEGQLNRLVEVLSELQEQIEAQQAADDQNFATTSESLGESIAREQANIDDATANLNDYQAQLADNQNALAQANSQLSSLQVEQEQLTELLAKLAEIRANEHASYQGRIANEEALIAGLQRTIDLFQAQTNNEELNQEAVAQILDLLNNLITAFQASIASDTAQENEADAQYNAYVVPRQARLEDVAVAIAELQSLISQLEATIEQLESRVESEQARLSTAEQLLAQYQAQLKDLTDRYTSNSATRTQQISLLAVVNQRLTQNAAEVQEVLNNA